MRRNLKTPYGAFEVEEAYYNNNGILYAKVVVEYDQNGTPRHPIPYDVNIGGSHMLSPGIPLERSINPHEREGNAQKEELYVEDFLR